MPSAEPYSLSQDLANYGDDGFTASAVLAVCTALTETTNTPALPEFLTEAYRRQ
jgi:hypothetical protein